MPTIESAAHLGLTNRFEVAIDGFGLGGFSKCEGLAVTFKLHDYTPLGHNDHLPVLPDRVTYERITLTRAVTAEDSGKVIAWLAKMAHSFVGGTGVITLIDSHRGTVATWSLRGVYPTKWKGPSLDANSHNIATETLELAHEGFLPE